MCNSKMVRHMYLDVKINNVPVQFEVKNVGPASLEDIDDFKEKIKSGNLVLIYKTTFEEEKESDNPYSSNMSQKETISEQIQPEKISITQHDGTNETNDSESIHSISLEQELEEPELEPKLEPEGKLESNEAFSSGSPLGNIDLSQLIENAPEIVEKLKTVLREEKELGKQWYKSKTFMSNILVAIACILGTIISDNPETSMYLPASILAIINLYLRSISKDLIKLPLEDTIKNFKKK